MAEIYTNWVAHVYSREKTKFGVKQLILQNVENERDITRWVAYRQLSSWRRETCMSPGPSTENVWGDAAVSYL